MVDRLAEGDPVTRTMIWHAFVAIAEESGAVIERTAHSQVIREAADFSTGVFDAEGRMLGQGAHSVGHLGSMNAAVAAVVNRRWRPQLAAGDVVIFNDPALGAGHLPDIYLVAPIFHAGRIVGFAANTAHHTDVGGLTPGSQAIVGVESVVQEGIFIPPIRLRRRGKLVAEVWALLEANSRAPSHLIGDLEAQLAGIDDSSRRYVQLVERYGDATVTQAAELLFEWSERTMREAIRTVPDGRYSAEDFMDGWGPGTEPIRMKATVTVAGDAIDIDWQGTSPQVPAGMNSYVNFTYAYSYFAVKCVVAPDLPQNDGCLRSIKVTAPEGTIVNPHAGAPSGGRAVMNYRIFEVVLQALAQAVPDRVIAPGPQASNLTFGGVDPRSGRSFVCYELMLGSFGGRATSDGPDGLTSITNSANVPIEINESLFPILIERFVFERDKVGAGQFRSSMPIRRDFRILADRVIFTNGTDRHRFPPPGLLGGRPGVVAETILNPGPGETALDSKGTYVLHRDDVLSVRPAGGGGYGLPSDRAMSAITHDLREGLISPEYASREFGVDLDADARQEAGA
jgi:N-methylhydantoinase B